MLHYTSTTAYRGKFHKLDDLTNNSKNNNKSCQFNVALQLRDAIELSCFFIGQLIHHSKRLLRNFFHRKEFRRKGMSELKYVELDNFCLSQCFFLNLLFL